MVRTAKLAHWDNATRGGGIQSRTTWSRRLCHGWKNGERRRDRVARLRMPATPRRIVLLSHRWLVPQSWLRRTMRRGMAGIWSRATWSRRLCHGWFTLQAATGSGGHCGAGRRHTESDNVTAGSRGQCDAGGRHAESCNVVASLCGTSHSWLRTKMRRVVAGIWSRATWSRSRRHG